MLNSNRFIVSLFAAMAISSAALAAETADVNGAWQLTVSDSGRTFTPVFILEQDGDTLTGIYRNSQGDNPAKGKVDGNEVTLQGQITSRDGNKRWVTYVGTVDGDSMTGEFQTDRAEVTFTAKREKN